MEQIAPSPLLKTAVNPSEGTQPLNMISFSFFIFIFMLAVNLILVFLLINKLPVFEKLKNQSFLEKTYQQKGLTREKLTDMNLINEAFANEKGVIKIISEINKSQFLFKSYSFSFDSDEPKKEVASYLPFTIKVTGDKEALFYLINQLASSKNIIEITEIQTGFNKIKAQEEFESILKANLYISDNYYQ